MLFLGASAKAAPAANTQTAAAKAYGAQTA